MNIYLGKSGQQWYEEERGEHWVTLRPEYPTGKTDQTIHIPIKFLEACGFRLVETEDSVKGR